MARLAAVIALAAIVLAAPYGGIVNAQTPPAPATAPASAPVTAADVAALRQTLEQLRAELGALNRRVTAIEEELNTIQSR